VIARAAFVRGAPFEGQRWSGRVVAQALGAAVRRLKRKGSRMLQCEAFSTFLPFVVTGMDFVAAGHASFVAADDERWRSPLTAPRTARYTAAERHPAATV